MLEAAVQALVTLFYPLHLLMLFAGVLVGLVVGILPGIGIPVAMALILPFAFGLDPLLALSMLLGAAAVTFTGASITSILFGIPGSGASVATIIDGFPLSKKGLAGRAIGAALMASMVGGLFGAVCLFVSLPIGRPLVLLLGSPEFFMLCILGIVMVAVLSTKAPIKGTICAGIGLMLSAIGGVPGVGAFRYTLGWNYLGNGIPLVVMVLGLFAIPEVIDMLIGGTQISTVAARSKMGEGLLEGIKDTFRNIKLVLRCAAIGAYIGFVPGIGGSVSQWLAYGHAIQTANDKSMFGKGDIRGVIAPEASNNASEGGALIPTILFGIPGTASMAILLGAFLIFGIQPGPAMLTTHLDVTFTLIWSLAIANVMGTAICLLMARPLAYLTKIRIQYLAPFIIMIVILGAFQSTRQWGDLFFLMGIGILGWFLKRYGYGRPPLLVGYVLGASAERYLYLSILRFGAGWLVHPGVIIIGLFTIVSVLMMLRWQRPKADREVEGKHQGEW